MRLILLVVSLGMFLPTPSLFARAEGEVEAEQFHLNYAINLEASSATLSLGESEAKFNKSDPPEYLPLATDLVASLELADEIWSLVISNNNNVYFDGTIKINGEEHTLLIPSDSEQLFEIDLDEGEITLTPSQEKRGLASESEEFLPSEPSEFDIQAQSDEY